MKQLSALLALCEVNPPVTGGFPSQSASNVDLWCFLNISQNKLLNKHLSCQWSAMTWHSKPLTRCGLSMAYDIRNLVIIDSDHSWSPYWCQAIPWTSDDLLTIETVGTNFSEILIKMKTSFKKMHMKMSPQCFQQKIFTRLTHLWGCAVSYVQG